MFKRKKGGSDSNPSDDHASSSSAIGEGVEFDKFDPEVNKGVFRKRDANELLAALSSGDLEEEKKGKKKRTCTSPRPVEGTTPRTDRSATASVLETVKEKGEEKEDRFLVEMDRLLDEYEASVHSDTADRELAKGRSAQDVRAGLKSSRSLRLEKRVTEADVDSCLDELLGKEEGSHVLEEFDDSIALDVLSLRKQFEVLTADEEAELKKREPPAPAAQGEREATADLLAAVAQFESGAFSANASLDRDVAPAPVQEPLMDSQALKDAILADIGDGKGTSSSKIKLQRNSAAEAFTCTGATDLKEDLLNQLAGGATSFAAVAPAEEESERERRAAESAALAVLAAAPLAGGDTERNAERGGEVDGEPLAKSTEEAKERQETEEEKGERDGGDGAAEEPDDVEELSQLLDNAELEEKRGHEGEADVQVAVLAQTPDDLQRSHSQTQTQMQAQTQTQTASPMAAAAAVAAVAAVGVSEGEEKKKKKKRKGAKEKRAKKTEGETKDERKERKARRKERGEGSVIGEREGKEKRHRSKEERKIRKAERRERKASLASDAGSEAMTSEIEPKSHVSRAKKSERKKHKRKHSDASSVSGGEKHKHRHRKKSGDVQKESKAEESEKVESRTPVARVPTMPSVSGREVTAIASPPGPVVHSLPPPRTEAGEEERKREASEAEAAAEAARAQKKSFRKSVYTLGPISDAGIGLDEFDFPDPEHIVPDRTAREDSRGTRFEKDGKWYFRPLASLPPPREFWGREKKYVRLDMHTIFRYDVNAHIEEFNASSD